ncbi:MAG: hypothetical protein A3J79_00665 [Elusimicrobia bacterium RIFOXYB2_FULL_62_6]|nr:MAG: hypothetical protein A3J79_00665 [Elusimicrobia bacterium RIFOXYB2_FULL_62_6]
MFPAGPLEKPFSSSSLSCGEWYSLPPGGQAFRTPGISVKNSPCTHSLCRSWEKASSSKASAAARTQRRFRLSSRLMPAPASRTAASAANASQLAG